VVPAEGPLRYWRTGYSRLEQHGNYSGSERPTRVNVRRAERNGDPTSNIEVTFRDSRGIEQRTWVHHSFLVPVGTLPVIGEVTVAQKVTWLNEFMVQQINDEEWGSSGSPSEWDEDDWDRWATAGNTAVLNSRALIESGSLNAGRVWCEAANALSSFHYEQDTQDFLHQWFVDSRAAIDRGLASLVPEAQPAATDANLSHVLIYGDLVAYEGRLFRVSTNQNADGVFTGWASDTYGSHDTRTLNRADVVWMEPGVARLRRRTDYRSTYNEVCTPGTEYVFNRVYSDQDRAIYVSLDGREVGFMCQSDFEPVLPVSRRWDTGRVLRTKQAVYMEGNVIGLCLAEDNHDEARNHPNEIKVYTRERARWVDRYYPKEQVHFAVEGDNLVHTDGTTATFVSNYNDPDIDVRLVNGTEMRWPRENVRYTGNPATPAPPKPNPVVVIDGIEYVRKDVVDADVETMKATLHKGSVEHSLCGVYDRVTAQSDAKTDYVKLGMRYRDYDVVVEQNVVIRRVIRVPQATDEGTARDNARRIANDYPPRSVEVSRRGEAAPTVRSYTLTDHQGPATVVG
jgi:hypothetical protein